MQFSITLFYSCPRSSRNRFLATGAGEYEYASSQSRSRITTPGDAFLYSEAIGACHSQELSLMQRAREQRPERLPNADITSQAIMASQKVIYGMKSSPMSF